MKFDCKKNVLFLSFLGQNLQGAQLSFTTHPQSCQWERKERTYTLEVQASDPSIPMNEVAHITINLPYYNSTLFLCLTPENSQRVTHLGDR